MVDLALLLIRVWLGVTFVMHGSQKLFAWFGGAGITGTARYLEALGIRPGLFWAILLGLGEFGGGISLALGFLTPLGALAIIIAMVVAIAAETGRRGFWIQSGGYEYNLMIIVVAVMLIVSGAGAYALDRTLGLLGP